MDTRDLSTLVEAARAASPIERIEFRDPIASHGDLAIDAVAGWLSDPILGAFAVRVVVAASPHGSVDHAIQVLDAGRPTAGSEAIKVDIAAALERLRPAQPVRQSGRGYRVTDPKASLRGRPAITYEITAHRLPGHFSVPREIMAALAIPTDGDVDLVVRRAGSSGVVFDGRMGIASGTEIYPVADDPSTRGLASLGPFELLLVTVAKAPA